MTGLEVFLLGLCFILFALLACAGACCRSLEREAEKAYSDMLLSESKGRLGERERCLEIVDAFRLMCPSETAVLNRVRKQIEEGE